MNGEANRNGFPDVARKRTGSTPKSVKIDESSLQHQSVPIPAESLEALIAERLRIEWIDLTKAPYTNSVCLVKIMSIGDFSYLPIN